MDYELNLITAKCGCRFSIGECAVAQEIKPGMFKLVAQIPDLEPPETPSGWARENVIGPHEDECLEIGSTDG